jgi:hypothetical protein
MGGNMYDQTGDDEQARAKINALFTYTENAHAYMRAIPAALDAKASILLTLLGGSLIYAFDNKLKDFQLLPLSLHQLELYSPLYVYLGASLLSLGFCVFALNPFGGGEKRSLFSIVSFASRQNADKVVSEVNAYSPQQLIDAQLRHCYELSTLCRQKSLWFRLALYSAILALISFFISQN